MLATVDQGMRLQYAGYAQASIDTLCVALDEAINSGAFRQEAFIRQQIGVNYKVLGQLHQALVWLHQAWDATDANDHLNRANIARDLGDVYDRRGQLDEGDRWLQRSASILGPMRQSQPGAWAATQGYLGRHYRRLGRLDRALSCLRKATAELRQGDDRQLELNHLLDLVGVLDRTGHRDEFTAALQRAKYLTQLPADPPIGCGQHRLRLGVLARLGWRGEAVLQFLANRGRS